jgi:hypothetical protein
MKRLRSKLTYANVISTLALFLVVAGGSAFAAGKLGKNTVGTKQIKKNAITAAKIKDGAVTSSKIALAGLGTVPSATNATRADSATHATSADTATSAGNAQTLGGKTAAQIAAESKVICPAGMKAQSGLCFETSPRPAAPLASAIFTCSKEGFWLPILGQLLAYEGKNYATNPPLEWTEPITYSGTEEWAYTGAANTTNIGSTFTAAKSSTSHPYRCVSAATN